MAILLVSAVQSVERRWGMDAVCSPLALRRFEIGLVDFGSH